MSSRASPSSTRRSWCWARRPRTASARISASSAPPASTSRSTRTFPSTTPRSRRPRHRHRAPRRGEPARRVDRRALRPHQRRPTSHAQMEIAYMNRRLALSTGTWRRCSRRRVRRRAGSHDRLPGPAVQGDRREQHRDPGQRRRAAARRASAPRRATTRNVFYAADGNEIGSRIIRVHARTPSSPTPRGPGPVSKQLVFDAARGPAVPALPSNDPSRREYSERLDARTPACRSGSAAASSASASRTPSPARGSALRTQAASPYGIAGSPPITRDNNQASVEGRWSPGGGRLTTVLRYTNMVDIFENNGLGSTATRTRSRTT